MEPQPHPHPLSRLNSSLWAVAAMHCVKQERNRPEAILHVVQQRHNLSVQLIGNGSRGSLIDIHKTTFSAPDAFVWHAHNQRSVLLWLRGASAPPNAYNTPQYLDSVGAKLHCK